jgi:hypothetical protein
MVSFPSFPAATGAPYKPSPPGLPCSPAKTRSASAALYQNFSQKWYVLAVAGGGAWRPGRAHEPVSGAGPAALKGRVTQDPSGSNRNLRLQDLTGRHGFVN